MTYDLSKYISFFKEDSKRNLEKAKKIASSIGLLSDHNEIQNKLREFSRIAHSIHGSSALLDLYDLEKISDSCEKFYENESNTKNTIDIQKRIIEDINKIERCINDIIQKNDVSTLTAVAGSTTTTGHATATGHDMSNDQESQFFSFGDEDEQTSPRASMETSFNFDDEDVKPTDSSPKENEFILIFKEEILGYVEETKNLLPESLINQVNAQRLERISHTIKGAAAAVGLDVLRSHALECEDGFEIISNKLKDGKAYIEDILTEIPFKIINLFKIAGIDIGEINIIKPNNTSERTDTVFIDELKTINTAVQSILQEGYNDNVKTKLSEIFHRIKGSSIVSGVKNSHIISSKAEILSESLRLGNALRNDVIKSINEINSICGIDFSIPTETSRFVIPEISTHIIEKEKIIKDMVNPPSKPKIKAEVPQFAIDAFNEESADLLEKAQVTLNNLLRGDDPKKNINEAMRIYHTLKGAANSVGLESLGAVLHATEDGLEHIVEQDIIPPLSSIVHILQEVQECIRSIGRHEVSPDWIRSAFSAAQNSSSSATTPIPRPKTRSDSGSSTNVSGTHEKKYIRVPLDRIEGLMNLVGELLIARSRDNNRMNKMMSLMRDMKNGRKRSEDVLNEFQDKYEFHGLSGDGKVSKSNEIDESLSDIEFDNYSEINKLSRVIGEINFQQSKTSDVFTKLFEEQREDSQKFNFLISALQERLSQTRLIQVGILFQRLQLPAHDAASRYGKNIRINTVGDELEMDKMIIDSLNTPLLHLVRNSVAHGIEDVNTRIRAGKNSDGLITLHARQEGSHIIITVEDDGAGINVKRVHEKALAAGIITPDIKENDPRSLMSIFNHGFSTKDVTDEVSGRGVGLDVVKSSIERIGGKVEIENNIGLGVKFILTIPITLAITKAVIMINKNKHYAIPITFIERLIDIKDCEFMVVNGKKQLFLRYQDNTLSIPVICLSDIVGNKTENTTVIVVKSGDKRIAIEVEKAINQEEIVIKPTSGLLMNHRFISGTTVTGEGHVMPVFDGSIIIQAFIENKNRTVTINPKTTTTDRVIKNIHKAKILFVDDSVSVRKVAESYLKPLNCHVSLAINGEDAWKKIQEDEYDLIFTDLEMPELDGFGLATRMRANEKFTHTPVVMVTSRSGEKYRQMANMPNVRINEYLTKPFTQEMLSIAIRKWCQGIQDIGN